MSLLLAALIRYVRSCLTLALLRLAYAVQPPPRKPPPSERLYSVMVGLDHGERFIAQLPALGAAHLAWHDYRRQVRA